jgi:hypothetical protein
MILDRLPQNITGFFDKGDQPRSLDAGSFKQACHLVAQMDGGTVDGVDLNLLGRSYFAATIRTNSDHLSVLCNSVYPYLAFVPPNTFGLGAPELTFVEPIHLAAAFASATNFQPLDAIWLQSDLLSGLLAELAPADQSQLAYWKPRRVGDVIFNSWD